jgi:hypothetical protein
LEVPLAAQLDDRGNERSVGQQRAAHTSIIGTPSDVEGIVFEVEVSRVLKNEKN